MATARTAEERRLASPDDPGADQAALGGIGRAGAGAAGPRPAGGAGLLRPARPVAEHGDLASHRQPGGSGRRGAGGPAAAGIRRGRRRCRDWRCSPGRGGLPRGADWAAWPRGWPRCWRRCRCWPRRWPACRCRRVRLADGGGTGRRGRPPAGAAGLAVGRDVLGPVGALMIWTIGLALAGDTDAAGAGALGERVARRRALRRGMRRGSARRADAVARLPLAPVPRWLRVPPPPPAPYVPSETPAAGATRAGPRRWTTSRRPWWSRAWRSRRRRRAGRGRRACRCRRTGWHFPPLSLLKPAPARAASGPERGGAAGERPAAGDGAGGLRRAGQHRGDPPRPGRDAVRAGAGAGHPQRARDRAGGRRGAQPVGHGGAHRHRARAAT